MGHPSFPEVELAVFGWGHCGPSRATTAARTGY